MESCNSGSMQSSSGCDEEYDHSSKPSSHDHSFSNFFNSTTPNNIQLPSTTIQPISLNTSSSSSSFFDPLPNYLDTTFSRSPPILMDDTSWLRPPLPHADSINNLMIPSSLSTHSSVVVPINNTITGAPSSSVQQRPGISPASRPRNSKKRSRASRRAPTTVLTTDTANFRAMVQEFTGIPTASFMPYSSLPPPRFDLLHSLPPYLLRPFAQKVHHHHPSPSPPLDHLIANSMPTTTIHVTSNAHTSAHTSTTTTTTSLGLNVMQQQQQQQQNPIHTFQSLQDQPPPAANISTQLTSKAPLEFDWQKGTTGQSHEGEDQRGAGMDSWVLSSD